MPWLRGFQKDAVSVQRVGLIRYVPMQLDNLQFGGLIYAICIDRHKD